MIKSHSMQRRTAIAIVGTGDDVEPDVAIARELGRLVALEGWIVITGGRDAGVMRAACEGAKSVEGSLTVGILPDRETRPSAAVDVAIATGAGEARNNVMVLSADVVIACGVRDPGTTSEVALALKNGNQVVLVNVDDRAREFFTGIGKDMIHIAESAESAIEIAKKALSRSAASKQR